MKSFKQFGEDVARKLVIFHNFSPDRAILSVKEYATLIRRYYEVVTNTEAQGLPEAKKNLLFDDASLESSDHIVSYIADGIGISVKEAFKYFRALLRGKNVDNDEIARLMRQHEGLIVKLGAKHVKETDILEAVEYAEGRKF